MKKGMENRYCAIMISMRSTFFFLLLFSIKLLGFPNESKNTNQKLLLNGVGLKEVTIFKIDVYKAAFYLPKKTSKLEEVNALFPKVISINFLRDISFNDLRDTLERGLKKYDIYTKKNVDSIENWKNVIPKITNGTTLKIIFTKNSLILEYKGKRDVINNAPLAQKFHLLWVGNKSDIQLRTGMLNIK